MKRDLEQQLLDSDWDFVLHSDHHFESHLLGNRMYRMMRCVRVWWWDNDHDTSSSVEVFESSVFDASRMSTNESRTSDEKVTNVSRTCSMRLKWVTNESRASHALVMRKSRTSHQCVTNASRMRHECVLNKSRIPRYWFEISWCVNDIAWWSYANRLE